MKRASLVLVLLSGLLLTNCKIMPVSGFTPYSDFVLDQDSYLDETFAGYERKKEFSSLAYRNDYGKPSLVRSIHDVKRSHPFWEMDIDAANRAPRTLYSVDNMTYYDQFNRNSAVPPGLSTNNVAARKILVVPVEFPDYPAENLGMSKEESSMIINNAFFGPAANNTYESVASYYNQSSYGKLRLEGKVTPWFMCDVYGDITANYLSTRYNPAERLRDITLAFLQWYESNFDDLGDYDLDQDNYVDSIFFVYSHPHRSRKSNFWAYTSFIANGKYELDGHFASAVAWASFDFLNADSTKRGDSRVYIHETGHLLGLEDYYSLADSSVMPLGYSDMMDINVGDHSPYSKMMLEWTRPLVLMDQFAEVSITLKPFSTTGEVILLKKNWNGSLFDEYYLIDFYTPDKLNYFSATNQVNVSNGDGETSQYRLFNRPGIRVYHVDSRLAYYTYSGASQTFVDYLSDDSSNDIGGTVHGLDLAHNNVNYDGVTNHPLIQLIDRDGTKDKFIGDGLSANNDSLFNVGDIFNADNSYILYDSGQPLGYGFEVMSLHNFEATLRIFKI